MLLKIAAAYIRVSDERQDEYSPDSQLKKIRETAEKDGYTIPDEYVFYDDGISGRSVKKRAEFNRMIAIAKENNHPFDRIYVWKFSRFARNQEEAILYKNLLRKKDVAVVSVSEPIPDGHFGSLIERILEWLDEYYSINLSTEVVRGMTEKVTRGEPICFPAFGYNIKDKKYIPNEAQAPIVNEIFTRYAQGDGMRAIAVDLGNRGIRTTRGNMPENRWIEYILNNPVYIGKIRWTPDGTRSASKRDYNNENVMIVDGHHDPIVTTDLWEKVQARLETDKKAYRKYAKKGQAVMVMTKGLVVCSACNGTLAVSSAKSGKAKLPTLQCCNYSRGSCHTSHSVVVPRLEKAIINGLKEACKEKSFTISPERKTITTDLTDYDKLIAIEERKLERAKTAYLSEIDTIEQYAENKKAITANIEKLNGLKNKTSQLLPKSPNEFAEKVLNVVEYIEKDDVTPQAKNEALRTIIDKIVYNKAEESVAVYFYE